MLGKEVIWPKGKQEANLEKLNMFTPLKELAKVVESSSELKQPELVKLEKCLKKYLKHVTTKNLIQGRLSRR
jgi:hypothetical protein